MLTSFIKSHENKVILNDELLIMLNVQNRVHGCKEAEILHWLKMNEPVLGNELKNVSHVQKHKTEFKSPVL